MTPPSNGANSIGRTIVLHWEQTSARSRPPLNTKTHRASIPRVRQRPTIGSAATRPTLLDKGNKHRAALREIDAVMPMPPKPGPNWPARSHDQCCQAKVKYQGLHSVRSTPSCEGRQAKSLSHRQRPHAAQSNTMMPSSTYHGRTTSHPKHAHMHLKGSVAFAF